MNAIESGKSVNTTMALPDVRMFFPPGQSPLDGLSGVSLEGEQAEWSMLLMQPGKGEAVHVGIQRPGKNKGELGLEFKVQRLDETDIASMRVTGAGKKPAEPLSPFVVLHNNAAIRLGRGAGALRTSILVNESPILLADDTKHAAVVLLVRATPDLVRVSKTFALTNPKGEEEAPEVLRRPDVAVAPPSPPAVREPERQKERPIVPPPERKPEPTIRPIFDPPTPVRIERRAPADEAHVLAELKEVFLPQMMSFSLQTLLPEPEADRATSRPVAHWFLTAALNLADRTSVQESMTPSDTRQRALNILRRGVVNACSKDIKAALDNAFYATSSDMPAPLFVIPVPIRTDAIRGKGLFAKTTYEKTYAVATMDWGTPTSIHPLHPDAKTAVMVTGAFSQAVPAFSTNSERGISEYVSDAILFEFGEDSIDQRFASFCDENSGSLPAILRTVAFGFPEQVRIPTRLKFYQRFTQNQLDLIFSGAFTPLRLR